MLEFDPDRLPQDDGTGSRLRQAARAASLLRTGLVGPRDACSSIGKEPRVQDISYEHTEAQHRQSKTDDVETSASSARWERSYDIPHNDYEGPREHSHERETGQSPKMRSDRFVVPKA